MNPLAIIGILVALYFGFDMFQSVQHEEQVTMTQATGLSVGGIIAWLSGAFAFIKQYLPDTLGGTKAKVVKMIELALDILEEQANWEAIVKRWKTSGFPVYFYMRVSWKKGESYPIEIGKDPDLEEQTDGE